MFCFSDRGLGKALQGRVESLFSGEGSSKENHPMSLTKRLIGWFVTVSYLYRFTTGEVERQCLLKLVAEGDVAHDVA